MDNIKEYSLKKDGKRMLSENFRVCEFGCSDGSDRVLISEDLVALLQEIRSHFGKAVTIHSAYRTASHNARVGGAVRSQHLLGTAADIAVSGVSPQTVAEYAEFLMPEKGGIGVYKSFTHVDVRSVRSRWDNRSGKEVVVGGWPGYTSSTGMDDAVAWVREAGIMQGNTSGDLMLESAVTRRQLAVMLHRYHRKYGK